MGRKIFIYTDADCDFDEMNVFLSMPYKNRGDFLRQNKGDNFNPLVEYDFDKLPDVLKLQAENKKLRECVQKVNGNMSTFLDYIVCDLDEEDEDFLEWFRTLPRQCLEQIEQKESE